MSSGARNLIIKYANTHKTFRVMDIVKDSNNKYSRQYISKLVQELVKDQILVKSGVGINTRYAHAKKSNPKSYKFDKTKITIKLYTLSSKYLSRSQARRLLNNLEKFNYIILDFKNVDTVGQAFADEIFRIYQNKRPDITIESINTNPNIDFMIKRVKINL